MGLYPGRNIIQLKAALVARKQLVNGQATRRTDSKNPTVKKGRRVYILLRSKTVCVLNYIHGYTTEC